MTSRNLYFKLMREDLKSRLWAAALLSLGCFFLYPVVSAFMAGGIKEYKVYEDGLRAYSKDLIQWLSFDNGMTVFIMVVTALVCGLSSFSYLNNKSKVDFFHGLPLRREKLYAANYINGILLLAVPYAVSMLLAVFVGITNGVEGAKLWPVALAAFGLHMTYYILLYTTVVIAAMMTGNLIIGFLGSVVFVSVVPVAVTLVYAYFSTFFHTYVYDIHEKNVQFFLHFSPLAEYINRVGQYGEENLWPGVAAALVFSAALAVLGCFLYRKRPSEAAGRAMVFPVSRPIVRNILTVISALGLGLFFWSMRESTGWAVFGTVCGGVICHCVIEIIYHFDFKKLFANKVQLAVCILLSIGVLFVFRYDLTGYDKYLPQAGSVREAAVSVGRLNNWVSYGETVMDQDGNYDWEYGDSDEFVFSHMQYQDIENLLGIAAEGIRVCEENKHKSLYRDAEGSVSEKKDAEEQYGSYVEIAYTLSSGRKVYRRYYMNLKAVMPQMEKLYADSAFQRGTFPLLTQEDVKAVHFRDYGEEKILDQLDRQELQELFDTYKEEFCAMSLGKMKDEVPAGLIRFTTQLEEDAIRWQERQEQEQIRRSYIPYSDMKNRSYYPVYPSFTKTLRLMKQHGLALNLSYDQENISSITFTEYVYSEYDREDNTVTISDPEEIKKVLPLLYNDRLQYYNPMLVNAEMDIEIRTLENGKENYYSAGIQRDKIPAFVTERLEKSR